MCFTLFVVAMRGFQELPAILAGLVPRIPEDSTVAGTEVVRDMFLSIRSIAGGALAAAPILASPTCSG